MSTNETVNLPVSWREWKLGKPIGQGAFGVVYEARRTSQPLPYLFDEGSIMDLPGSKNMGMISGTDKVSAIKVISIPPKGMELDAMSGFSLDKESERKYCKRIVEEFQNEILSMGCLKDHPNIVQMEDYYVSERPDGTGWDIFIRMEKLTCLKELTEPLKEQDVVRLGMDICRALEHCSKYNLIHRDIKPQNIFLSGDGGYKLGDFGTARLLENTTSGLSRKGTPLFMAPEVFKTRKDYGKTVDIYSLGLVLYQYMNQGRVPFLPAMQEGEEFSLSEAEKAFYRRMLGETLPSPSDASPMFARIILKACAFQPEERYQSAGEMLSELERLYSPVSSRTTGSGEVVPVIQAAGGAGQKERADGSAPEKEKSGFDERAARSNSLGNEKPEAALKAGVGKRNSKLFKSAIVIGIVVLAVGAFGWKYFSSHRLVVSWEDAEGSQQEKTKKAAEQGDASAQISLGLMYRNGEGVDQSNEEAAKWFEKAAEQGDDQAQIYLAYMYEKGEGVEQSYDEAAKWYEKAAEQGNAFAQDKLGYFYKEGHGVGQDIKEAVKWYEKAAEQGVVSAQVELGTMYLNGNGVEKDYEEALKWFEKAAEQGDDHAQTNLGYMYMNGYGVVQDYAEALKWLKKAAEQGNSVAQSNIGFMYENGLGVARDHAEAEKWYEKAASNGN